MECDQQCCDYIISDKLIQCAVCSTDSSVVSWPGVLPQPVPALRHRHRAVDLRPGAVEDGGGKLGVLGGGERGHGVGAARQRGVRALGVGQVVLVPTRAARHGEPLLLVHVHHQAAGIRRGGRPRRVGVRIVLIFEHVVFKFQIQKVWIVLLQKEE